MVNPSALRCGNLIFFHAHDFLFDNAYCSAIGCKYISLFFIYQIFFAQRAEKTPLTAKKKTELLSSPSLPALGYCLKLCSFEQVNCFACYGLRSPLLPYILSKPNAPCTSGCGKTAVKPPSSVFVNLSEATSKSPQFIWELPNSIFNGERYFNRGGDRSRTGVQNAA